MCGCRMLFVGGMRLDMIPYACAEIPPAGAPSGFDSAAFSIVLFVLTKRCRSAQDDTEADCCVSDTILIRQSNIAIKSEVMLPIKSNIAMNRLYPTERHTPVSF